MGETRFHEAPCGWVERLAGRLEHFLHDGWNGGIIPSSKFRVQCFALQLFLAAFLALTSRAGRGPAGAFSLQKPTLDRGEE
jgi:hypothetical protein